MSDTAHRRRKSDDANYRPTVIRARWIVGFDGVEHRLIEDGVVVYEGDRILHVGKGWDGEVGRIVDAGAKLVIPGLISTHAHLSAHAGDRLVVDSGRRDFLRSGFINYEPRKLAGGPAFLEREDSLAAIRFGMACLIRHGVTTAVEMGGGGFDGGRTMAALAGESGMRLYYGPGYTAGEYHFDEEGRLVRSWVEEEGLSGLERAVAFAEEFHGAHDGRLQAMLIPYEAYNCTPELLRRTRREAARLGIGISLHVAEQVWEFHETLRLTGLTPVGVLAAEGFLGPEVILGHCRFVGGNSQTAYPHDEDLDLIVGSGASVAHAPVAGGRRGSVLESFQHFLDRGVRLSIGTDTYPLDIIQEMRWTALLCKVTEKNHEAASARTVFDAATIGGANALRRDDLGRLAPGAKADIVIVDLDTLRAGPVADPIRTLVHAATGECVETVIADGRTLVEGKRLLVWDESEVLAAVRRSTERVWSSFADYHWSGRGVDEVFPPSLPAWRAHAPEAVARRGRGR